LRLLKDNDQIPLFDAEKQQKTPVQARRRRNPALQVVDSAWIIREFRYAANSGIFSPEQRYFSAAQLNCSGICLLAGLS
jgi:hypothetical protein